MPSWTAQDIPDLHGTTAVVTGANSGIGLTTATALAGAGACTLLACRDRTRGEQAAESVRGAAPQAEVQLIRLDLADLTSVREAAEEITAAVEGRLDLLINNAGVMALPSRRTRDGFEMQFGTNHLGHFALTGLLMPVLGAVRPSRVVSVSSLAHRYGRIDFDNLNGDRSYGKWSAYGQSKLANLLFTEELNRRAQRAGRPVSALAAHPGLSSTNLGQAGPQMSGRVWAARMERLTRLYTQPATAGALPVLRAATDPDAAPGDYFGPGALLETRGSPRPARRSARVDDPRVAEELWAESVRLTGVEPDFAVRR